MQNQNKSLEKCPKNPNIFLREVLQTLWKKSLVEKKLLKAKKKISNNFG
jgi:hypothetical protein